MKPFTTIAGLLFLIIAAVHAYRLYTGFAITAAGYAIPVPWSWAGVVLGVILGAMLLSEARR
jgi:hypothetical protein